MVVGVDVNRCTSRRTSETVGLAWEYVSPWFGGRFPCDVFMADPVFAGLHDYETTFDGRSYHDTMHVCYPFNISGPASRRRTTIVIPHGATLYGMVHEFGHILDGLHDFGFTAKPVSEYAKSDRHEAFAEAFAYRIWFGLEDEESRSYFDHWEKI